MTNSTKILLAALIVLAFNVGLIFVLTNRSPVGISVGAVSEQPAIPYWVQQTATNTLVSLTATDVRISATSSQRHWLTFVPAPTCTQGAYISLANDAPATANNSIFINASSSLDIDTYRHPYIGAVHAISNGGTCPINVTGY